MKSITKTDLLRAAMLCALTCAGTLAVRIPVPGGGYVNGGDLFVFLCGWLCGGTFGALAAGIGSSLADLLGSYAQYIPATFCIKAVMALICHAFLKREERLTWRCPVSLLCAGVVMTAGYFLYEAFALSYGAAAWLSLPMNLLQTAVCAVGSVLLFWLITRDRTLYHRLFRRR